MNNAQFCYQIINAQFLQGMVRIAIGDAPEARDICSDLIDKFTASPVPQFVKCHFLDSAILRRVSIVIV